MSLIKKKDRWGRMIAFGVAEVVLDYNNMPVSTTENEYGKKYKFKICGGYKLADRKKDDGSNSWLKQELWCSLSDNHPLAKVVCSLSEHDVVFIYGRLRSSKYTNPKTGNEHRKTFCDLEYISLAYHANGDLPNEQDYSDGQDFDENDDIDF